MRVSDYSHTWEEQDEDLRHQETDRRHPPKLGRQRRHHRSDHRSSTVNGIHRRRNKRWTW